ncbi:hypothetical protein NL676_002535 [Syzygium grande]|nr:hypothetical protein NL676_002535 [Syzygium grande]
MPSINGSPSTFYSSLATLDRHFDVKWHPSFACGVHHPVTNLHLYIDHCCLVYQIVAVVTFPCPFTTPLVTQAHLRRCPDRL